MRWMTLTCCVALFGGLRQRQRSVQPAEASSPAEMVNVTIDGDGGASPAARQQRQLRPHCPAKAQFPPPPRRSGQR